MRTGGRLSALVARRARASTPRARKGLVLGKLETHALISLAQSQEVLSRSMEYEQECGAFPPKNAEGNFFSPLHACLLSQLACQQARPSTHLVPYLLGP